jgi:hypothetical protein
MHDVEKARRHRDKAARLNKEWGVGARQARYHDEGYWYALLKRFPAALFDAHGSIYFATEPDYKAAPMSLGKQIYIKKPGISAPTVPDLVARLPSDVSLRSAASQGFPGIAADNALALAVKFSAGFWGVAKATRDKYAQGAGLPDVELTLEQRGEEMNAVHEMAQHDKVVDLGACFGWWGRTRPDRRQPVFDQGISDAHKRHYLADYYKTVGEAESRQS